ncbi:hypothetical protein ACFL6U_27615 [Planctomycetota bacterium]
MTKNEINETRTFIADIHESLCMDKVSPYELALLYDIVKKLMDQRVKAKDKKMKLALISLEHAARQEVTLVERRLATNN